MTSSPDAAPPTADPQPKIAIQLEGIGKSYDGFWAVRDLDIQIPEGEFFAFLGPNGAGKTTTIKMLTGLLQPTTGRALLCGLDIQKEPMQAKRLIGHIPDHPYLYEKLTGRDFFTFIGDLYEIDRKIQEQERKKFFELFGLEYAVDRLIENYSHGMRQKLCFAVALMHNPKVILVDEPLVGLDPQSARIVKNLLLQKCREGTTVFMSTHLLAIAEQLAHRIGIITKGRLQFLGTMTDLRAQVRQEGSLEDLFLELTANGVTYAPGEGTEDN